MTSPSSNTVEELIAEARVSAAWFDTSNRSRLALVDCRATARLFTALADRLASLAPPEGRRTLADLLQGVTPENTHPEVDFGRVEPSLGSPEAEALCKIEHVLRAFSDLAADSGLWPALTDKPPSAHAALELIDDAVEYARGCGSDKSASTFGDGSTPKTPPPPSGSKNEREEIARLRRELNEIRAIVDFEFGEMKRKRELVMDPLWHCGDIARRALLHREGKG